MSAKNAFRSENNENGTLISLPKAPFPEFEDHGVFDSDSCSDFSNGNIAQETAHAQERRLLDQALLWNEQSADGGMPFAPANEDSDRRAQEIIAKFRKKADAENSGEPLDLPSIAADAKQKLSVGPSAADFFEELVADHRDSAIAEAVSAQPSDESSDPAKPAHPRSPQNSISPPLKLKTGGFYLPS